MPAPQALLVDMDGVLVVSWKPLPGTRAAAFDALRDAGVPMRFLTNTTSRTKTAITDAAMTWTATCPGWLGIAGR